MNKIFPIILGFILGGLIAILPCSFFNTWEIQVTAAITALMVIWWITEAVPLPITSLIPIIGFPLTGILTLENASVSYADPIILLFLGGFIIAASMQHWNLHKRIALTIIMRIGNSPKKIILGFMVATAFLSLWMSNTTAAMMMIPVAISIIGVFGLTPPEDLDNLPKDYDFAKALVLAIAFSSAIGGLGTIIGTPPNGIFLAQLKTLFPEAPHIGFLDWMTFGIPLVAILIPLTWVWLVYGSFRHLPDTLPQSRDRLESEIHALGPMNAGERWTLVVFVMVALMWIFSATKEIGAYTIPGLDLVFPRINDCIIAIFGAVLLFLLPVNWKKGEFTMNWATAVKIPWEILLLFGGGICLSKAFTSSGLAEEIVNQFASLHSLDIITLILVIAIVVTLLSELASNIAIATIMMPIMAASSLNLMVNPIILMIAASLAASFGFMLPVASASNAIAFGTGYVSVKDMIKSGCVLDFMCIFLMTIFVLTFVLWGLGISLSLPEWAIKQ